MNAWPYLDLLWCPLCYWLLTLSAGTPLEPLVCASLLGSMLLLWRLSPALQPDPVLFAACVAIGPWVDLGLASFGLVDYASHSGWLLPLWIITLWACFAGSLGRALRPLLDHAGPWIWLPITCGPPLAYAGGARLGAAHLAEPAALSLLAIALGWWLVFTILRPLARRRAPAPNHSLEFGVKLS